MTDPLTAVRLAGRYLNSPRDGALEQAVRDELGLTPTRFWQIVNAAIDDPAVMAAEPVTCRVLRERRAARQRQRSTRLQA